MTNSWQDEKVRCADRHAAPTTRQHVRGRGRQPDEHRLRMSGSGSSPPERPSLADSREDVALRAWTPSVDVYEDEEAFLIKLELPEISRDDVKVSLNDNTLSISGERRVENEQKRENYHRVERKYGQFYRSFTLPPNVDTGAISAQFKDGMLRLTIPKKEEAKPRQIEVNIQ